jgi:hypothetical protein
MPHSFCSAGAVEAAWWFLCAEGAWACASDMDSRPRLKIKVFNAVFMVFLGVCKWVQTPSIGLQWYP